MDQSARMPSTSDSRAVRSAAVLVIMTAMVTAPLAAQRLPAKTIRQIDSLFASHAKPGSPGCAVGLARNGVRVFTRGYGTAVVEHGVPITPRTAFNVGSISKQFTAFATLLLEREGLLSLDDDIRQHLPDFPKYDQPITVRDLLQHTSGLRDYVGLARLGDRPVRTPERTAENFYALLVRQRALNFTPGTQHEYVHTDYNILGLLLERVTGKPLGEVLTGRIWGPLGMTATNLLDPRGAPIANQALAYVRDDRGVHARFPVGALRGGTDVYSTVEDMLRWSANFDRPVVGDRELLAHFVSRPGLAGGDTIPYVHGIRHGTYRGLPVIFRGGHGAYFTADHLQFPTERVAVVTLCNDQGFDSQAMVRDVAAHVLGERLALVANRPPVGPASITATELERVAGFYYNPDTPWLVVSVFPRDGELHVTSEYGGESIPMRRLQDGRYELETTLIAFEPGPSGRAQSLAATLSEDDEPIHLPRWNSWSTWSPAPESLDDFAGTFYSDDVLYLMRVVRSGNQLALRRAGRKDVPLIPLRPDIFGAPLRAGQPVGVVFVREGARIVGLEMNDLADYEVVRHLRFDRIK